MDIKFNKDSGDSQPRETPGEKKNQSALLVLLLILIGGFTYIYYFTDLIKPQEAKNIAETSAPAPQASKIPLPARSGAEPAKQDGKAPNKVEVPKPAATVPVTAAAPAAVAAKPAIATAKTVPPTAKPASAPIPVKPKEEPKKIEAAKTVDKKPQPVPATDKKAEKAVAAKTEDKKAGAKKPAADGQAKPAAVVKAKPDSWSLVVGNYVLEEALATDMGRVRKAGFEPIIKPAARKSTPMNRLLVSEFNDRASAQPTLNKLKNHTSDAFIIEHGGKITVYAGSYLQNEAANQEKERLKAVGFTTTVKRADIAIPSQSLSIGPFSSKTTADAALAKLKSAGIKATLTQK